MKMQKGDRVKLIGNYKHEVFATVIRRDHKNHFVINIDGDNKNVEWNENRLEKVEV